MSEWYDYMIRASKHAKDDNELWIRYLYKVDYTLNAKLSNLETFFER